jgi:carboxyl-terminal processing protease
MPAPLAISHEPTRSAKPESPCPTRRRAVPLFGALALAGMLLAAAPASATLSCDRVPELLRSYLDKHYTFRYLNDELRNRTVESYIKRLDPSKSLFLVSEKEALAAKLQSVFHDVRRGDCKTLLEIRDEVIRHYVDAEKFTAAYVGDDAYALDESVELIIDPERRARPKTPAERDDLSRRLIHFQMSNYLTNGEELAEAKRKLIHRYELMTKRARELSEEDVYASFLDAFAGALDPHSNYLPADAVEDFQIGMELSLEGIGVALTSRDGYSIVEKIIPGGAADRTGGIAPGDKIIAVAQAEGEFTDIIDMDLRDVVRLIRGKRGTTVRLSILRQAERTERLIVSIERDEIKLEDQAAALRFETIDDGDGKPLKLAVLELPSFYGGRNPTERQSSRDMRELLRKVKAEKADGLLLDLSRNGGGLLDNSVEIAGFFIRNGGVVAVKDSYSKVQVLSDPDESLLYDGPMVLLTSRVSASASEIVAGAMKDYRRAIVVGDDHTFGKGTVQSMVQLPKELGALKVTTALFFRPGGSSTQHAGVEADIVFPSLYSANQLGEKHQDYSLPGQKIDSFLDTASSPTANQSQEVSWQLVTPELVARLADLSAKRVSESEDFAEIVRQIRETEEKQGVLHLSDIYKPGEKSGKAGDAKEEAKDKPKDEASAKDAAGAKSDDGANDSAPKRDRADAGKGAATPGLPGEGSVAATGGDPNDLAHIPTGSPAPDPDVDPEEPSPQQREALRILADWVRLNG